MMEHRARSGHLVVDFLTIDRHATFFFNTLEVFLPTFVRSLLVFLIVFALGAEQWASRERETKSTSERVTAG